MVQLAEIRRAGHDVVVGIERIGAETVAEPKARPCLGHDLHQPHRAFRRHGPYIAFDLTLRLDHGAYPRIWNAEPMRRFGVEKRKGIVDPDGVGDRSRGCPRASGMSAERHKHDNADASYRTVSKAPRGTRATNE